MPASRYQGPDRRKSDVEKHIQTIIAAVLLALVLWAGSTMLDVRDRMTKLEAGGVALQAQVAALQVQLTAASDDRYRASDARRDFEARDRRMEKYEERLDRLEKESHYGLQRKER